MQNDGELPTIELSSSRLRLRQWHLSDYPAFASMNRHPEVMAFFPSTLTTTASNALAHKCQLDIAKRGWGLWALEMTTSGEFIGFTGFNIPSKNLPFSPCIEIAWRLARPYWRQGYATEAAQAALEFGFNALGFSEVVAFTAQNNFRSRAVMLRLNMQPSDQNFLHPDIDPQHPLAEQALFSLTRERWHATHSDA
ncbi:GNAT family N-acetyltransferase [Gilvimarinus chinensis]|uniref:GNAT family N-acetyltransferase n=1 Tax=Gilvimarinus chinensis TaxID=396005 RepID=UPI00035DE99C|nr:GNAT family N-acetyltransferase [Gilvimarinus chinensis]